MLIICYGVWYKEIIWYTQSSLTHFALIATFGRYLINYDRQDEYQNSFWSVSEIRDFTTALIRFKWRLAAPITAYINRFVLDTELHSKLCF